MDTHFTFVFAILLAILCTSATALRFVASKRILGRLGAEDWLAFAALVSFLAYISLVLASTSRLVAPWVALRGSNDACCVCDYMLTYYHPSKV